MPRRTTKATKPQRTERMTASTGKNFHIDFKNDAQSLAWAAFKQHDVLFLIGPAGTGKALTLDSKLYTRTGAIRMGDVKVGDEIANPDGSFSKVTGVFPQGKKQVCRVHFSDQTHVDCCEDHLWSVSHSDNGWKDRVVDTRYIEDNCRREDGKRVLSIKCPKPVNFDRASYNIPPYLMGVLISEGNLTNSNVCFSSCDEELVGCVVSELDSEYTVKTNRHNSSEDHRLVKVDRSSKPNKYKEELKRLGLWGKYSYEKFIPTEYLFGSVDQRVSLLQGLMDGDGTVEKTGSLSYSTTSYELACGFCQLVYSLGGKTNISIKEGSVKADGTRHRVSYRCYIAMPDDIEIFFISRKKKLRRSRVKYFPKRYVDRVERLGMEEMQCISVDHKDSLYLTDNYTVTHNTHLACAFAIEQILSKEKERLILTRPVVESGESLGFLPGEFEEKIHPYMLPMYDCITTMVGREGPWRDKVNNAMEIAPIAYMRGRSFQNAVCIFDEAQNASMLQLKLFLTRFCDNTKIIVTGDPSQSDLAGKVALIDVVHKLKGLPGVGVVEFKSNSIVRHPLVGKIIERLEAQ